MKRIVSKLVALLVMSALSLADVQAAKGKFPIERSTKVARFDFMCAIESGDVATVVHCLNELNVNERWADGKTPLMFAIEKLAEEQENQESLSWKTINAVLSLSTLAGLSYGAWLSKDHVRSYVTSFEEDWLGTVRTRWQESVAYPVGGIVAVGAAILLVTSLVKSSKNIGEYIYYRWKTSTSRLMIIEKLINHPSIDLSVRNEIKNREGVGQTALDLVQDLQRKEHYSRGYIHDLLYAVETMIQAKLNPVVVVPLPIPEAEVTQ